MTCKASVLPSASMIDSILHFIQRSIPLKDFFIETLLHCLMNLAKIRCSEGVSLIDWKQVSCTGDGLTSLLNSLAVSLEFLANSHCAYLPR